MLILNIYILSIFQSEICCQLHLEDLDNEELGAEKMKPLARLTS